MYVTLVTEDDPSKLQSKMSQSQDLPKDLSEMDKGKAKNKTANVKTIPAKKKMGDPRIKVTDKDGIKVFKCSGHFKSMTGAKQHLPQKHRARSEDDQDGKEEKKLGMDEELKSRCNEDIMDKWGDKDEDVITASQAATIEDIMSENEGVNVVSGLSRENTERMKQVDPPRLNWNQDWR